MGGARSRTDRMKEYMVRWCWKRKSKRLKVRNVGPDKARKRRWRERGKVQGRAGGFLYSAQGGMGRCWVADRAKSAQHRVRVSCTAGFRHNLV